MEGIWKAIKPVVQGRSLNFCMVFIWRVISGHVSSQFLSAALNLHGIICDIFPSKSSRRTSSSSLSTDCQISSLWTIQNRMSCPKCKLRIKGCSQLLVRNSLRSPVPVCADLRKFSVSMFLFPLN